jgi:hypothetical protein
LELGETQIFPGSFAVPVSRQISSFSVHCTKKAARGFDALTAFYGILLPFLVLCFRETVHMQRTLDAESLCASAQGTDPEVN